MPPDLPAPPTGYTPREIADALRTSADRILDLIHAGELRAIDIGAHGSRRKTWRIPAAELERWLASRSTLPPAPKPKRRCRKAAYVPTYY